MLSKENSKTVTIVSAVDKRSLSTGTFSITLSEKFLLMPLIYGRKLGKVYRVIRFQLNFA